MEIRYHPVNDDYAWNYEVSKIIGYCFGNGLDVGCGTRTINPEIKRLDIDPKKKPDILASGDNIPCEDGVFDYICAIHALEHFEDQDKALKEWLRVVKISGYILIIHPDVTWTKQQKGAEENPSLKNDPFNKHYHERTLNDFIKWIEHKSKFGFRVVDFGKALPEWSFYCILQKTK